MLKLSEQNHRLNTVQIESDEKINRLEEKCKILSRENQDLKNDKSSLETTARQKQDLTLTIEKLRFELQNEQNRAKDAEKKCSILEKRLDVQAKAECEAAALQAESQFELKKKIEHLEIENKNLKFEEPKLNNKALIESTVDLEFVSITKQNKDEISFLKSQIASLKNQMNDSIDETLQNSFAQVTNEFESFIRNCLYKDCRLTSISNSALPYRWHSLSTLKSTSSMNETDLDCTNRTDLVDDFKNRLVEIENRLDSLPETA